MVDIDHAARWRQSVLQHGICFRERCGLPQGAPMTRSVQVCASARRRAGLVPSPARPRTQWLRDRCCSFSHSGIRMCFADLAITCSHVHRRIECSPGGCLRKSLRLEFLSGYYHHQIQQYESSSYHPLCSQGRLCQVLPLRVDTSGTKGWVRGSVLPLRRRFDNAHSLQRSSLHMLFPLKCLLKSVLGLSLSEGHWADGDWHEIRNEAASRAH